jgi:collagen type IV alpha
MGPVTVESAPAEPLGPVEPVGPVLSVAVRVRVVTPSSVAKLAVSGPSVITIIVLLSLIEPVAPPADRVNEEEGPVGPVGPATIEFAPLGPVGPVYPMIPAGPVGPVTPTRESSRVNSTVVIPPEVVWVMSKAPGSALWKETVSPEIIVVLAPVVETIKPISPSPSSGS